MHDLPPEFWQGVEQFNQRQFYACHDTLEALWIEAVEPDKKFYQGILQVAVGLYHLSNHNWRGAVILLGEGMNRLQGYQPEYGGIAVEAFLSEAAAILKTLQEQGADRVVQVAQMLFDPTVARSIEERSIAVPPLPQIRREAA
jgi:predicted metal-dependent hydrolase